MERAVVGGRFQLGGEIGVGAFGTVHRALDLSTGRTVAVKILRATRDERRFLREAEVLRTLKDPRIVGYVSAGTTPAGEPFVAMEWLEGKTLRQRLEEGGLTLAETVSLLVRMAGALGTVHRAGVVHRDLKPSNILLVEDDAAQAILFDFGVAHLGEADGLTSSGDIVGTWSYMSPEQARGDAVIDGRSDLFSLGCVAYECLVGARPFGGLHSVAVVAKILLEDPPAPCQRRPEVPKAISTLVMRLLSKQPGDRGADAGALLRTLEGLDGLPPLPAPERRLALRPAGVLPPERSAATAVLGRQRPRRRTLSEAERHLVWGAAVDPGATLSAEAREALTRAARPGHLQFLPGGVAIASADDGPLQVAEMAVAIRAELPGARIAVALGETTEGPGNSRTLAHRLIEVLGRTAPGEIRVDREAAAVLEGRIGLVTDERGPRVEKEGRGAIKDARRFVGRERELAMFRALFDECRDDRVARAMVITGPPGQGKTRLIGEMVTRIRAEEPAPLIWLGPGHANDQTPFRVLRQMIASLAGENAAELRKLIRRAGRAPSQGLGLHHGWASDAARGRLLRLASECVETAPLLIVVDDAQWGDRSSLELLDWVIRAMPQEPVLVIAAARAGPGAPRDLFDVPGTVRLDLPPLTARHATTLVSALCAPGRIEAATVDEIVERGHGNPLVLEELVRAASHGSELPGTVLEMVQARIRRCPADARRVLRAAAILGEELDEEGLAALVREDPAEDVAAELAELVSAGLLVCPAGGREHAFRHSLVQEAAYAMVTEPDRRLGHALAAEWLAGRGANPALLAQHWERGEQPDRASAQHALVAAQALAGGDLGGALEHARRAIELAPDEALRVGRHNRLRAEAYRWLGRFGDAEAEAREALSRLPPDEGTWFEAVGELVVALGDQNRSEEGRPHIEEARRTAPPPGCEAARLITLGRWCFQRIHAGDASELLAWLPETEALLSARPELMHLSALRRHLLGTRDLIGGRLPDATAHFAEAAAAYAACENVKVACNVRIDLGFALAEMGRLDEALRVLRAARETAELFQLRRSLALAAENETLVLLYQGRYGDARRAAHEAIAIGREVGVPRIEGGASIYLAWAEQAAGRLDAAEAAARRALAVLARTSSLRAEALAVLARTLVMQGRGDEARQAAHDADAACGAQAVESGHALVDLAWIEAHLAIGREEAARERLDHAVQRIRKATDTMTTSERDAYLEAVPAHAALLRLAAARSGAEDRP